jgi:hypothetical protein
MKIWSSNQITVFRRMPPLKDTRNSKKNTYSHQKGLEKAGFCTVAIHTYEDQTCAFPEFWVWDKTTYVWGVFYSRKI